MHVYLFKMVCLSNYPAPRSFNSLMCLLCGVQVKGHTQLEMYE